MRDGHLEASGHNWVEGQGSGPRIDKNDAEEDAMYDAMGNKIDSKKMKKLTAAEARKVCTCPYVICTRILTNTSYFRPRRSEWHGRNEARTAAMNCEVVANVSFSFHVVLYLCLLAPPCCVCH